MLRLMPPPRPLLSLRLRLPPTLKLPPTITTSSASAAPNSTPKPSPPALYSAAPANMGGSKSCPKSKQSYIPTSRRNSLRPTHGARKKILKQKSPRWSPKSANDKTDKWPPAPTPNDRPNGKHKYYNNNNNNNNNKHTS